MSLNCLPTEANAIVGVINPDVLTAAAHSTGWIDAGEFQTYMAVVQTGTLGSSATIDAKLEQATDASGTGAKDIAGKAITQLTQAGSDSDKEVPINLRGEELDTDNGFTHFRLTVTVATASSDGSGIVIGCGPRYGPASDHNLASVGEIVN